MVKIGEKHDGCCFWGYEPASGAPSFMLSKLERERIHELREQFKRDLTTLTAAGYAPVAMGFTKAEALEKAEAIENRFDITMRIFNHDYL